MNFQCADWTKGNPNRIRSARGGPWLSCADRDLRWICFQNHHVEVIAASAPSIVLTSVTPSLQLRIDASYSLLDGFRLFKSARCIIAIWWNSFKGPTVPYFRVADSTPRVTSFLLAYGKVK